MASFEVTESSPNSLLNASASIYSMAQRGKNAIKLAIVAPSLRLDRATSPPKKHCTAKRICGGVLVCKIGKWRNVRRYRFST